MNDKPIATLAPLPGGPQQYLTALIDMLRWISMDGCLYRSAFIERVMQHYNAGATSVPAYIQTLRKFGLITINKSRQLLLTAEGEAALTATRADLTRRLLDRVLPRYVAAVDILAFYASSPQPVHVSDLMAALHDQYPDWQTPAPYQERVRWLVGLDCLQQVDGVQSYVITGLGRDYVARYTGQVGAGADPVADSPLDRLIAELHAAAVDGSQPQRFEHAVAEAFARLGFPVEHIGIPGDTDVLLMALREGQRVPVVIDTKARRDGRLSDLEIYTLQDHARRHDAAHIVVIAAGFAGQKILRQAEETGLTLLPVACLADWLALHQRTPLSLDEHSAVFGVTGLVQTLPDTLTGAAAQRHRFGDLLRHLVTLMNDQAHTAEPGWTAEQFAAALAIQVRETRFTAAEVQAALDLLANPLIRAAHTTDHHRLLLTMPLATLVDTLRRLARLLS